MTYYVLCNVETGSVLDVSENELTSEGHPVSVRIFEGEVPNPLTHIWNKSSLSYDKRMIVSFTHIQFRKLFTQQEELTMDAFNDTYQTLPYLNDLQKMAIRTGLKKYAEALAIELTDPGVSSLLDLYAAVGILTPTRKQEVLNGEFKQT